MKCRVRPFCVSRKQADAAARIAEEEEMAQRVEERVRGARGAGPGEPRGCRAHRGAAARGARRARAEGETRCIHAHPGHVGCTPCMLPGKCRSSSMMDKDLLGL